MRHSIELEFNPNLNQSAFTLPPLDITHTHTHSFQSLDRSIDDRQVKYQHAKVTLSNKLVYFPPSATAKARA